jgi:glycogen synthase
VKILMTADTVGGVWTYALDLCAGLAEAGIEVVLAAMGPGIAAGQREDASNLPNVALAFRPYALEWMNDPWRDVDESRAWLLGLAQEHHVSLVHANTYAHGCVPFGVPTLVVGHSCVFSWYQAVRGCAPPPAFATYHRRVVQGLQSATSVVAPSHAMLGALLEHYGPLPSARTIWNGRRLQAFAPRPKQPFILSSGRLWDEAKNVETLARAATRLTWPVCVAGSTTAPEGTERALEGVTPLGLLPPSRLAGFMSRASIYALPARYEPFGLSVLEAAASGCALVLGDIPSLREIWGDAALYVPPEDADALTEVLGELMASTRDREDYARRARQRALALDERRMARAYLSLYEAVSERSGFQEVGS